MRADSILVPVIIYLGGRFRFHASDFVEVGPGRFVSESTNILNYNYFFRHSSRMRLYFVYLFRIIRHFLDMLLTPLDLFFDIHNMEHNMIFILNFKFIIVIKQYQRVYYFSLIF